MSFTLDMGSVYQQFINIWSSLMPVLVPFIAIAVAVFLFGGIIWVVRKFQQ